MAQLTGKPNATLMHILCSPSISCQLHSAIKHLKECWFTLVIFSSVQNSNTSVFSAVWSNKSTRSIYSTEEDHWCLTSSVTPEILPFLGGSVLWWPPLSNISLMAFGDTLWPHTGKLDLQGCWREEKVRKTEPHSNQIHTDAFSFVHLDMVFVIMHTLRNGYVLCMMVLHNILTRWQRIIKGFLQRCRIEL